VNFSRITVALFLMVILFLLIQPFVCSKILLLNPSSIGDYESTKIYYTAVGTIAAVFLSILGLTLGYMYFQSRIQFDSAIIKKQRECACAQLLIGYLDEYDSCLDTIFKKNFETRIHLNDLRSKFDDIWDKLLALLESDFAKDIIRKEERGTILEIHSYINKQEIICNDSDETVRAQKMDDIIREYKSRYRMGRKICISRVV